MRVAPPLRPSQIAIGSVAVAILVLALKALAAWWTGSIALYSDALESVVNLVTAGVTLFAVRLAARPADAALPYGYHKIEYFSAVIIGVFISIAAILIFREAWFGFFAPRTLVLTPQAIAVSVVATAINGAWAYLLMREGRRQKSPSLEADGHHLSTDAVSTAAVLAGVAIVAVTGAAQLDALLAALVGLTILWSGWQLIRRSVVGLMDVAVDPSELARIREIISTTADGAIEAHDIRTRRAGARIFIDFHLVVPGAMSVDDAHAICDAIEAKLRESVDDALITIHVEPENKAKHWGIVVV